MIYGSMYDAVMNWALNDPTEASKVTGPSTSRGLKQPTGTEVEDGREKRFFQSSRIGTDQDKR